MNLLTLHSNGKPVKINADNIVMYCWNSENGKVNLVTNYLKGVKLEVDESLYEIDQLFNLRGSK